MADLLGTFQDTLDSIIAASGAAYIAEKFTPKASTLPAPMVAPGTSASATTSTSQKLSDIARNPLSWLLLGLVVFAGFRLARG